MEFIHMTAAYSNAVLVAILPHVSDFAKKLDLPIPQPITATQVLKSRPSPYQGRVEASVVLTNHDWFLFDYRGFVVSFTAATNWFSADEDSQDHLERYIGKTQMTTNEILALARTTLLKLGHPPALSRSDTSPEIRGPIDLNQGGHVPFCRVSWEPIKDLDSEGYSDVKVEINTQLKSVVGLYLGFARTNKIGTPLKVDMEPETQSQFQKRTKATLYYRTNAPSRAPGKAPPALSSKPSD